ncbi:TIGR01244 family sulfur transferase [Rhizobacter sp. OV335]|uniref:TIGR01244 family sulfur transferase n=1 Tax=Rhizobacter sp. OV335 TaxID=1500264 RepID=UPI00090FB9E9|nr:TIGR01244 family sulfur transferase [Rhizobacter sp. OV335]SHN26621.1 TIGR01244 family protein [Rhizobacter sp. OV335]
MSDPVVQQLSAEVCVAPQLEPAAMAWAAQQGFRSVINNRPDFEGGPDQPTSAVIEAAARAAGLQYAHLPVAPAVQTPEQIAEFASLLAALPKPILAFCRTGTRSGKLFRAATGTA